MGKQIDPAIYGAFVDELTKESGVALLRRAASALTGTAGQARAAGRLQRAAETGAEVYKRIRHPISYGLPQGWKTMTPTAGAGQLGQVRRAARLEAAGNAPAASAFRAASGKHLLEKGKTLREAVKGPKGSRVKAVAEEMSRRGWTGKSKAFKYLPVGEKAMVAGFPMAAIPGVVNAPKATPTGEGGAVERAGGELLGAGGWVLGAGLGGPAGIAAAIGGSMVGSRLGRFADRMRAGANPITAATAPSPTKARKQLSNIQRYYG